LNEDGLVDIIAGGNKFGLLPQFCRLDASLGTVLLNKGNKKFSELTTAQSGLELTGEVRDIQTITANNNLYLFILQNNQQPVLYRVNKNKKPAK
jgi:hypothetical protein